VIVDSSAVIAWIKHEPDARALADTLASAERPRISAATFLESCIVAGPTRHDDVDDLLAGVEVVPFDRQQALAARDAYLRYGKGSGSPARLNLGDCFSYALAAVTGEPLLFKGDDFTHTDVTPAIS
jgi:ribonuclease VapC